MGAAALHVGVGEQRARDVPASCHKAFADLSINPARKGEVPGSLRGCGAALCALPGAALTNGS